MVRSGWLVFALLAGVAADRFNRKWLILIADCNRFLLLAVFAVVAYVNTPLPVPEVSGVSTKPVYVVLLVVAFVTGMLEVLRDNAMQAIVPSIVPLDKLESANGRLWAVELLCNSLVGPMLGGVMLLWGPFVPFAFAMLTYAVGAATFLGVDGAFDLRKRESSWWQDIREATNILLSHSFLFKLAAVAGAWNLFFSMSLTTLILHVQENLDGSSFDYGTVLAVGALGGALGGWCGSAIIAKLGPGRSAQYALLFSTPGFFFMATAPTVWSLALVYFLFNFSGLVWNTVSVSFRQRALPNELRGRINSLYRLTAWALIPLGILTSGLIVELSVEAVGRNVAITLPFYIAALGVFFLSVLTWSILKDGFEPRL